MPEQIATRFQSPGDGRPDAGMLAAWERDGFLVLDGFYTAADCARLRRRAAALLEGFDPDEHRTPFNTRDYVHARDDYFCASAAGIGFFLEPGALDEAGNLVVDKRLAVNKIGHALHDVDPEFDRFSRNPRLAALVAGLGVRDPLLVQSMYLCKQPRIGDEVPPHQDSTFLHTRPESVIGLWVALEDATVANGCMWAAAGAHRGSLRRLFHRREGQLVMETLDTEPLPQADTPLPAPSGTLVVLHGRLPHCSGHNTGAVSRHAYAVHVVDANAEWSPANWLQRPPDLPLRGFQRDRTPTTR